MARAAQRRAKRARTPRRLPATETGTPAFAAAPRQLGDGEPFSELTLQLGYTEEVGNREVVDAAFDALVAALPPEITEHELNGPGIDRMSGSDFWVTWRVAERLTPSEALHRARGVADAVDWPAGCEPRGVEVDV